MKQLNSRLLKAYGGPWKDLLVRIPSGGTIIFSLKGWHGRYDMNGRWHNV